MVKKFIGKAAAAILIGLLIVPCMAFIKGDRPAKEVIPEKVSARLESRIEEIILTVMRDSSSMEVEPEQLTECSVLFPVIVNYVTQYGRQDEIYHFPIADKNGKIVLIYSIGVTEQGSLCGAFGPSFSPLLEYALERGETDITLYSDGHNYWMQTKDTCLELVRRTVEEREDLSDPIRQFNNRKEPVSSIVGPVYINAFVHLDEMDNYEGGSERSVSGSNSLTGLPLVDQLVNGVQYDLCWAASAASMIRFEKPNIYGSLTAQDIADHLNIAYNSGGSPSAARQALEDYLGSPYSPTYIYNQLSDDGIVACIDNVDPIFLQCRKYNGWFSYTYRAMVIGGYDFTGSTPQLRVMDPEQYTFIYAEKGIDGKWTLPADPGTMTWVESIYFLYSTN